jgi:hypothetical protein
MTHNVKIPSPWSQLALFVGLLGASLVLYALLVAAIYHPTGGLRNADPAALLNDPRMMNTLKWLQALSSVIVFGIPGFFYALQTFRNRPLTHLGFRPAVKGNFYLLAVLLLLVAFPLEGWLGEVNRQFRLPVWMNQLEKDNDRQIAAFLRTDSVFGMVINLVVVAALPALFEEVCFRGALQRILISIFKNPWTGIVVTGILFSAFHMQFQGFLPRMFLGILLGASCWYSGSLWTSIIAHFVYNGIQVVAVSFYPAILTENPSVPSYTVLISMVIVVGLLYWMRRVSTVTYAGVFVQS